MFRFVLKLMPESGYMTSGEVVVVYGEGADEGPDRGRKIHNANPWGNHM